MDNNQEKAIEATKKSIAHWERMIAWAKKQPKKGAVLLCDMYYGIHESWKSTNCELCREYFLYANELECCECPLAIHYQPCESGGSKWYKVNQAANWGNWVEAAEEMLNTLVELSVKLSKGE